MSKVRVVFAEVDGSDEMVRSVISQFAERVAIPAAIAAPAEAQALPAIAPPAPPEPTPAAPVRRASPVAKPGRPRKNAASAAPAAQAKAVPTDEGKTTVREQILRLLQRGPKTSLELVEAMPERASNSVYTILGQMRTAGEVETKADDDGVRKNYLAK